MGLALASDLLIREVLLGAGGQDVLLSVINQHRASRWAWTLITSQLHVWNLSNSLTSNTLKGTHCLVVELDTVILMKVRVL